MMNLMIFVFGVTLIIKYQHINIVSIKMLFVSTINARKKIINLKTVVRKTIIYIKKKFKREQVRQERQNVQDFHTSHRLSQNFY